MPAADVQKDCLIENNFISVTNNIFNSEIESRKDWNFPVAGVNGELFVWEDLSTW